jgi:ankyrin repeat protein
MPKLWTRAFGLIKKISVSAACMVVILSALFLALPSGGFISLSEEDLYWGCPWYACGLGLSIDGDWHSVAWDYLTFDWSFWILYFCLLGIVVTMILRKIGIKIRPLYSLCIVGIPTVILYVHIYRPDIFINSITGGYLGFFESRPERLNLAIRLGDVETVRTLLRNDPDLVVGKSISIPGGTPLQEAAIRGQSAIVELLLAAGAAVNAKDHFGNTPLFWSAFNGNVVTAELLLKSGGDVNIKSRYGRTPLYVAAEYGNSGIVKLLLASNADVNVKAKDGSTPLLEAAAGGYERTAQSLIASRAEIDATNDMGQTPLYMAAGKGNKDVVELLLANKANINAEDWNGDTPLQNAIENFHKNLAEFLRQRGATNNMDYFR